MDLFSYIFCVFLIINYWNFNTEMFVLRLSISVPVSKNIFRIINKQWGGVQISIGWGSLEKILKLTSKGDVYVAFKNTVMELQNKSEQNVLSYSQIKIENISCEEISSNCNLLISQNILEGTLMQIWKSAYVLVFTWKQNVQDFTF